MIATVVAAFGSEVPKVLRAHRDVAVVLVGPGARTAPPRWADGSGPVLILGSCGALAREAAPFACPGEVVLAGEAPRAADPALHARLLDAAAACRVVLSTGRLLQVPEVADGAARREDLRQRHGAAFVDMESATLARAAATAGRPWAVLRYVTDSPEQPLSWLRDLLGAWPEREPGMRQVLRCVAARPRHAGRLVGLGLRLGGLRRVAGRIAAAALSGPGDARMP